MKRKIVLGIVAALLVVALVVPAAFAAVTDAQKKSMTDYFAQILESQKKLVQTYVDSGLITEDQGNLMIQNMEQRNQYRIDALNSGSFTPGAGCIGGFGGGCGMGGGFGRGFGGSFGTGSTTRL